MVVLALFVAGCGSSSTASQAVVSPAPAPTPSPPPFVGAGVYTVTYCVDGGESLQMDIAIGPAGGPVRPAVMYMHGGAFETGDRKGGGGFLPEIRAALVPQGFVVASIDYRLFPKYKWPAPLIDAKCAIRFLRANASTYGIDPARIGVWGDSAGGMLASLIALAPPSAGFDQGANADVSSTVSAVAELSGPADLTQSSPTQEATKVLIFGSNPIDLQLASPIHYVTPGAPPFLILQGDRDETVPLVQSQEFAQRLSSAGDTVKLVIVHGGAHVLNSPYESPKPDQLAALIVQFFSLELGRA